MDEADLQEQQRNKVAVISERYGSTSVAALRSLYGDDFAPGFSDDSFLAKIVLLLDQPSLQLLLNDHDTGELAEKVGAI